MRGTTAAQPRLYLLEVSSQSQRRQHCPSIPSVCLGVFTEAASPSLVAFWQIQEIHRVLWLS